MAYRARWSDGKNHTFETMAEARLFLAKKMLGRADNFAKTSIQRKMLTEVAERLNDLSQPLLVYRETLAGSFWAIERIVENASSRVSESAMESSSARR